MSKVICDVCGTSYPETTTQCPICGCARTEASHVAAQGSDGQAAGYTYVKGGRFSKSNVRKRNQAAGIQSDSGSANPEKGNGQILVITAVVLVLAIIAVLAYIMVHIFNPAGTPVDTPSEPSVSQTLPSETEAPTQPPVTDAPTEPSETQPVEVPCTDIELVNAEIKLTAEGEACQLDVKVLPEDTTDSVSYQSSDEEVATVTIDGRVVAFGNGEAVITITCGEISKEVNVLCQFGPDLELKLNRDDFTLSGKGSTWDLYTGEIDDSEITWTSDNENIATVKDGVVTAVGNGDTKVHAEYRGQKKSCIVRCYVAGSSTGVSGEGETGTTAYTISATDVTISVGETFTLTLKDSNGTVQDIAWEVTDSSVCSVSGNTVKGEGVGTARVKITYKGEFYYCIVRVN